MAVPAGARAPNFSDPDFARRFSWKIWRRAISGSLVGAGTLEVVFALVVPVYPGGISYGRLLLAFATGGTVALGVGISIAALVQRSLVRRATQWIVEQRPPVDEEVFRITALPRQCAQLSAVLWALATPAVLLYVRSVGYRFETQSAIKATLVFAFGALISATLAYLFVEAALRPLLARVLPADTDAWRRTLSVTPRLLITWLVVSGVPLTMIAMLQIGLDAKQREIVNPPIVFCCLITATIGAAVFVFAGRTITTPLKRLHDGLARVEQGDLDSEVVVDEAGEIGVLQARFNRMVAGLRERERVRDLFGRHVGVEVARRAMYGDYGLGGEQRHASAMFVDVIASTRLAQTRAPDEVVSILNAFFDAVVRVVSDEGGLLNKFAGDGAMCIFGAPDEQPDHADRALRAAAALHEKLAGLDGIAAAIGVSSGEVVAGNVGALDRYEYTVVGDPVNEASRLTDEAKQRSCLVLVSAKTIEQANSEGRNWRSIGAISLRGRAEPTEAYELA